MSSHLNPARYIPLLVLGCLAPTAPAMADFKVRSPIVDYREFEYEHNGSVTFDRRPDRNKNQSYTHSVGVGVTEFWKIEFEGETGASTANNLALNALTFENTFQLTPQGKYWADLGFFIEYSHATGRGSANTIKFGPIVQKQTLGFGKYDLLHTINLLLEKEVGPYSTTRTGFQPAWQSRVLLNPYFEPGFEIYGNIENIRQAGKFNDQQYSAGPMFAGGVSFAPYGSVKYEIGYSIGMTTATPRGAVRWKFEYEIPF